MGICLAVGAEPIPVVGSDRKKRVLMERFPRRGDEIVAGPRLGEMVGADRARRRRDFATPGKNQTDLIARRDGIIVMDATMGDYFRGGWDNLNPGARTWCTARRTSRPLTDLSVFDVFGCRRSSLGST